MFRHTQLAVLLVLAACAEVPRTVCFSDEPCADAGLVGGGGGAIAGGGIGGGTGGGGALGGGAGGGGAIGGGTGGGTGGATGGGDPNQPVTPAFSRFGIANVSNELVFPSRAATPPAYTVTEVTLTPGFVTSASCDEAFRGAVALHDGRVLAIPFCVDRFAVIDPLNLTAEWIGPSLTGIRPVQPFPPGSYGGGVFGCDGRIYALPHFDETRMMRITPESDGGFTFDELPLSLPGPHRLSGGVIARSCLLGFRIIAAGQGGLFALDPTEGAVRVTPLTPPAANTRTFVGVARLGDSRVVSAPATGASDALTLWVDSNTLAVGSTSASNLTPSLGAATLRSGSAFVTTESGTLSELQADAGTGLMRSLAGSRLRWPTNSLTGWVLASGQELVAFNEDPPPPGDAVLLSPAVADSTDFTSGGLVVSTSGALVSVPGKTSRSVITIYTPAPGGPVPAQGMVLSPWFNKL